MIVSIIYLFKGKFGPLPEVIALLLAEHGAFLCGPRWRQLLQKAVLLTQVGFLTFVSFFGVVFFFFRI